MENVIEICFTCLCTDRELIKYKNLDTNIASFYERFVADGTEMNNLVHNLNYLCENCCMQLKNSYCFWMQCMQSKSKLEDYISELENRNRNFFNMSHQLQPVRDEDFTIKTETDEEDNFVLMEIGSMNQKKEPKTEINHMYDQNSYNEEFALFNNFGESSNFNETSFNHSSGSMVIKTEDDDVDDDTDILTASDFHNMDFNIKMEVLESSDERNNQESPDAKSDKDSKLIKPYQCHICTHKFVNKGNLKRHIHLIHSDKSASKLNSPESGEITTYQCTYCPKKLASRKNLERHMKKHDFRCKICSQSFFTKSLCTQHEEKHTITPTIFECFSCKTKYENSSQIKNDSPFKCQNCYKTFNSEEKLRKHKSEPCVKPVIKSFQCQTCSKKPKKKVKNNSTSYSDDESLKCMYQNCDKTFPNRLTLKEHIKYRHIQNKKFECPICFKYFLTQDKFDDHQNLHLNLKPYECMICYRKFALAETLDSHLKSHANMHNCEFCPKSFLSKTGLNLHQDMHKNETYKCNDCNLEFNCRSSMYRHFRIHKECVLKNSQVIKNPESKDEPIKNSSAAKNSESNDEPIKNSLATKNPEGKDEPIKNSLVTKNPESKDEPIENSLVTKNPESKDEAT